VMQIRRLDEPIRRYIEAVDDTIQAGGIIMIVHSDFGRLLAVVLANLIIAPGPVRAAADLDLGFGTEGRVITDLSGRYEEVRALAIQPDGQIVAAGVTGTGSTQDFALARYNTGGALDANFGTAGAVATDFAGGSDAAWAVAIQPDGKIVAAGVADGDFALARYHADGSLDLRFGIGGKITVDLGGDDKVNALAFQPDGKIVTVGVADTIDFALARWNADGTLDATFANQGSVRTGFSSSSGSAFAVTVQLDGMIVAAGYAGAFPGRQFALVRYNVDGSPDASFGAAGKVTSAFSKSAEAHFLAVQPDGKIIVQGFVDNGSSRDAVSARYNADGSLDSSFGIDGLVVTDFGGRNFASAVTMQLDGRVVVAGFDDFPPYYDFALARYEADGQIDVTFGRDGRILTEFGGNSWINALAIQADGKIVAAGYVRSPSGADFVLVRYDR
jgi:uncharacterized delta-60 repeat protein